jgi:tetratricopeptide (TPR) repeat protein
LSTVALDVTLRDDAADERDRRPAVAQRAPALKRSGAEERRRGWMLAAIVVAACALHVNTLDGALVLDDLHNIPHNRLLEDPSDVTTIFTAAYPRDEEPRTLYRPLTVWTLALNSRLNTWTGRDAADPVAYHVVNVLLHATVGALLWRWVLALGAPELVAAATALLFVVHPIHTEPVAQIVGRAELLAAAFGLIFLTCLRRRGSIGLAVAAYALALWSKESAVALLPLAVVMEAMLETAPRRWSSATYGACAAVTAGWWYLRAYALRPGPAVFPFLDNPLVAASTAPRVLTALGVQVRYLLLELIPFRLSSDYSFNQIPLVSSPLSAWSVAAFVLLGLAAVAVVRLRRSHPRLAFAIVGYGILFGPTSNIVMPFGTIMAERLAYAPSMLFCLAVASLAWPVYARRPRLAAAGFVLVLVVFGALTVRRNRDWHDEDALYSADVRTSPNSARAHFSMGVALALDRKDDRAAIVEYERALAIYPDYADAWFNLGNSLRRAGASPGAVIDAYRHTIRLAPRHVAALVNLLRFLAEQGRLDEAGPVAETLRRLDPGNAALSTGPAR